MPTDSIGTWEDLGTVAVGDSWQLYPYEAGEPQGETFRLTYGIDWQDWENLNGRRSFGLIRVYYSDVSGVIVGSSQKIYPKQEKELRTYPAPKGVSPTVTWTVGVRRVVYKKYLISPNATQEVVPWSLKIEYLI